MACLKCPLRVCYGISCFTCNTLVDKAELRLHVGHRFKAVDLESYRCFKRDWPKDEALPAVWIGRYYGTYPKGYVEVRL